MFRLAALWEHDRAEMLRRAGLVANVFVVSRRMESGNPGLDLYVVKDRADRFLGLFRTEQDAVKWARAMGHSPLVVRSGLLDARETPEH